MQNTYNNIKSEKRSFTAVLALSQNGNLKKIIAANADVEALSGKVEEEYTYTLPDGNWDGWTVKSYVVDRSTMCDVLR